MNTAFLSTTYIDRSPGPSLFLIPLLIGWFAFSQTVQAANPPPDGGYPGGNTAEGQNALLNLTSGTYNTAVGWFSLASNANSQFNTALGAGTLFANTGDNNTAVGAGALLNNSTGGHNTANGTFALFTNSEGTNNTAIGDGALLANTADENTAVGRSALSNNTSGSGNTAEGVAALAFNTSGAGNTAIGFNALLNNTIGMSNTAVGALALQENVGISNTATAFLHLVATRRGTATPAWASEHSLVTRQAHSIQLSAAARSSLTRLLIQTSPWANNTTGSNNTAIGAGAGENLTIGDNNIDIANPGVAGESATIRIGSGNQTSTFLAGINGTAVTGTGVVVSASGQLGVATSSARFKYEIKPMDKTSEALFALKPVCFRYKKEIDQAGTSQFGLVAEQAEKVNPDLVVRDKEGKPYTVRYDAVNAMLLNEFLKEHRTVQEQGVIIARLQRQIEGLTAGLEKVSAQLAVASPSHGGLEASKPVPKVVNNP